MQDLTSSSDTTLKKSHTTVPSTIKKSVKPQRSVQTAVNWLSPIMLQDGINVTFRMVLRVLIDITVLSRVFYVAPIKKLIRNDRMRKQNGSGSMF